MINIQEEFFRFSSKAISTFVNFPGPIVINRAESSVNGFRKNKFRYYRIKMLFGEIVLYEIN